MTEKIEFLVQKLKNGSGIHIKKSRVGSFTKYCNGKVTNECIQKGLRSPSAAIRKKANFARNSRTWNKSKHRFGGLLLFPPIVKNLI